MLFESPEYSFTIPEVVPCQRARAAVSKHGRLYVYQPGETKAFQAGVKLIAGAAIRQPIEGYWAISLRVHTRNRRKMDLDNIAKSVVDGIVATGKVPDDSRLWRYTDLCRVLGAPERIEVTVMAYDIEPRGGDRR